MAGKGKAPRYIADTDDEGMSRANSRGFLGAGDYVISARGSVGRIVAYVPTAADCRVQWDDGSRSERVLISELYRDERAS